MNDSRLELSEKIIEFRTNGAVLRSKTRWYNESEKTPEYFPNLENVILSKGQLVKLKQMTMSLSPRIKKMNACLSIKTSIHPKA